MAEVIRIRLLGGFGASSGERDVPGSGWRLRKAKTLVKLLALQPSRTLHVDQVTDVLWPERDPAAARNNLHQALHAARQALSTLDVDGAAVVTLHDDLVTLGTDTTVVTDLDQLADAVRRASDLGDSERLAALLLDTPTELLPEDGYETWLQPHAAAYRELRHQAVMAATDGDLRGGHPERAVALLTPLVAADPLNEPAVRALMRGLAASGRRSEALLAYERLRTLLDEELAADPEPETKALFRELLGGEANGATPAGIPAQRRADNLPAPMTTLVGRGHELDDARSMLGRTRLLTLTGLGGVGKTSLAIELGRRVVNEHPGGVWLVELAGLRDGAQVAPQIVQALQLDCGPGCSSQETLTNQLRDRQLLLVLDNCEHVLDASADIVTNLLETCPGVRVLATSREPLRIAGEMALRTPSLALPDPADIDDADRLGEVASVDLFVRRAAGMVPGFGLTSENARAVFDICHRLDGIPLALELAAACIPTLAPAEIAARLEDAIVLLRRGARTAVTRQQTLEATLAWSHDLLSQREQVLFRRLGIFAGSFSLDAAAAVCEEGLDAGGVLTSVARLVDTSFITADVRAGVTRYRLLDTVRQYALLRLRDAGEVADLERRHCAYYLQLAVARDPELVVAPPAPPLTLDVEHDNLRSALWWSLRHAPAMAIELAVSLWRYWLARGLLDEGRRWLEATLTAVPEPSASRARALVALAAFDVRRGAADRLDSLVAEAVDIHRALDSGAGLAQSLHAHAVFAYMLGNWDDCWHRAAEARDVAARSAAPELDIGARHLHGVVLWSRGHLGDARGVFEEVQASLERTEEVPRPFLRLVAPGFVVTADGSREPRVYFEETVLHGRLLGVQQALAHVTCHRADLARAAGDLDESLALLREAEEQFALLRDVDGEATVYSRRGCLHRVRGEYPEARLALTRSLVLRRSLGERRAVTLATTNLGLLDAAEGDVDTARQVFLEQIRGATEMRDVAGEIGLTLTLASVEADAGADAAADLHLADVTLRWQAFPGGAREWPWALAMHAGVLDRLGRSSDAVRVRGQAHELFLGLGAVDGVAAVARVPAVQSHG